MVYYHMHLSLLLHIKLTQMNPVHTLLSFYFLNVYLTIMLFLIGRISYQQ